MVGLIPLFAVEVLDQEIFDTMPEFTRRLEWFLDQPPRPCWTDLTLGRERQEPTTPVVAAARTSHEEDFETNARRERVSFGVRNSCIVESV